MLPIARGAGENWRLFFPRTLAQVWTSRRQSLPSRFVCGSLPLLFLSSSEPNANDYETGVVPKRKAAGDHRLAGGGEVRFLPLAPIADPNPRRYFGRIIYYPTPVDTAFFLYLLLFDSVHQPVQGGFVSTKTIRTDDSSTRLFGSYVPVAVSDDRQWSMNPSRQPVDRRISSSSPHSRDEHDPCTNTVMAAARNTVCNDTAPYPVTGRTRHPGV